MNDRRFLTAADENAILITVEFYEDGSLLKAERGRLHRFDLDLIVPDDITLNQLLDAVRNGIRSKLIEEGQPDPEQTDINDAYDEIMHSYQRMLHKAQGVYGRRALERRALSRRKRKIVYNRVPDADGVERFSVEQQEIWKWLVCWKVYNICKETYDQGYPQRPSSKIRRSFHVKDCPPHPVIACGNVSLKNWENGAFLSMARTEQIWLEQEQHGEKTLRELGFLSAARLIFDPIACHSGGALLNERVINGPVGEQFPLRRPGWRLGPVERTEQIHIKAADDVSEFRKFRLTSAGIGTGIGLLLLLILWAVVNAFVTDRRTAGLILIACGFGCCIASVLISRRLYRKGCFRWRHGYETYIRGIIRHIVELQKKDAQRMECLYPPVYDPAAHQDLIEQISQLGSIIYSRSADQSDFLKVRIGTAAEGSYFVSGGVEFIKPEPKLVFSPLRYKNIGGIEHQDFRVLLPGEQVCSYGSYDGTSGYLDDLPGELEKQYAYMKHVPVLMDLKHNSSLGVLYRDKTKSFLPLLSSLILDLCCNHTPDHLQMVMFCPVLKDMEKREAYIRQFRQLPHFQMLLRDISPFVFDRDHGRLVLDRLHRISQERRAASGGCDCHIVVLVLEEYGLNSHPLAQLMSQNDCGLTFVHFAHFDFQLPAHCSHVLERTEKDRWSYIPRQTDAAPVSVGPRSDTEYAIEPDPLYPVECAPGVGNWKDRMLRSYKILSAIYHMHFSRSTLPRFVSMLQLLDRYSREQGSGKTLIPGRSGEKLTYYARLMSRLGRYIRTGWARSTAQGTFRFPVGRAAEGIAELDLADPSSGPSLLITGGSDEDRTRCLMTILLSAALHHSPDTMHLLLVDPTADGLTVQMSGFPHVSRSVGLNGSGDLLQSLHSLQQELKREIRDRLEKFALVGVSDLRTYNQTVRRLAGVDGAKTARTMNLPRASSEQPLKPLRRLVLAVDHVSLLARLLPEDGVISDLISELEALMRSSEHLGIHVILSAEPGEEILPAQLLDRFRSRLCLKVTDRAVSERIIGAMDAAAVQMPENGRAFLYQPALGGIRPVQIADCDGLLREFYAMPFQITYMNPYGRYELFYDSRDGGCGADEAHTTAKRKAASARAADGPAAEAPVKEHGGIRRTYDAIEPGFGRKKVKPRLPYDVVEHRSGTQEQARKPESTGGVAVSGKIRSSTDREDTHDSTAARVNDTDGMIYDQAISVREFLRRLIEKQWEQTCR